MKAGKLWQIYILQSNGDTTYPVSAEKYKTEEFVRNIYFEL